MASGFALAVGEGNINTGIPGRGGITRGRADAPMIWGQETPGQTDQFEGGTLPGARRMDAEHSSVVGVGAAAPNARPVGESGGNTGVEAAGDRVSWRRRLSPRHRRAVKDFFTDK